MAIQLIEVNLPPDFLVMLKMNTHFTVDNASKIIRHIHEHDPLKRLIQRTFSEFDSQKKIEGIISTLGWSNFRDRLTSVYLLKVLNGSFPFKTDPMLVNDLVSFEEKLVLHSVEGFSRSFMLGFYFKLIALHHHGTVEKLENLEFYPHVQDAIELLPKLKARMVKLDWLIIQLMHFCEALGKDAVGAHLENGDYHDIYAKLPTEKQTQMVSNFLSYSYAIQDRESIVPPLSA
jgi:hypothetical protein